MWIGETKEIKYSDLPRLNREVIGSNEMCTYCKFVHKDGMERKFFARTLIKYCNRCRTYFTVKPHQFLEEEKNVRH